MLTQTEKNRAHMSNSQRATSSLSFKYEVSTLLIIKFAFRFFKEFSTIAIFVQRKYNPLSRSVTFMHRFNEYVKHDKWDDIAHQRYKWVAKV